MQKKLLRDKFGRFIKGFHYSSETEIKKGEHLSKKTEISKGKHLSKVTEFKKVFSKEELNKNREDYQKRWRENNKEKIRCHRLSKEIKIPVGCFCQECNKKLAKIKHHKDYNKPLEVEFLCYVCHNTKIKNRGNFAKDFHKDIENGEIKKIK